MSRIALFAPQDLDRISGNNTTRRRLAHGLRQAGHEVAEIAIANARDELERLRSFELLHALHALRTGVQVRAMAGALGIPYVVSITGTDINADPESTDQRQLLPAVLVDAAAVLCASRETAERLRREIPLRAHYVHVPKGVDLPPLSPLLTTANPAVSEQEGPCFLQVAGWRNVKNNFFALAPLERLSREFPGLRLRFAGPVIEPAIHQQWLRGRAQGYWRFGEDAGEIPPRAMAQEYAAATVVLNTSHAEGGANAVLEAMAAGRVVLASDIEGNRATVHFRDDDWEGSTGILYRTHPAADGTRREHDAEDFYHKARRLVAEPELRAAIARNARAHIKEHHSPEGEIGAVLSAYRLAGLKT